MAATGTGVLSASNYSELSTDQKNAIDLSTEGNLLTAKVLGGSPMIGLELKTTSKIDTFNVRSGTLGKFNFTGSTTIRETLTVGAKGFATGKINLGKDSLADRVNLDSNINFQGKIQNFGIYDNLKVKGVPAYTADDIRANGTIRGLDGITFT